MGYTYLKATSLEELINNPNIKLDYDFLIEVTRKLMGYAYKKVTLDELRQFAIQEQLALDHAALATYAKNVYGDKAHKIVTDIDWHSDDEGGMNASLNHVAVYDSDDDKLVPFPKDLIINYEYFKPTVSYAMKQGKSLEDAVNDKIAKFREYVDDGDSESFLHHELYPIDLPDIEGTWLVNQVPDTKQEFYVKIVDPELE